MQAALESLLQANPQLWRGKTAYATRTISTGFAALDAELPGQGWPATGLIELLYAQRGSGELSLLMPAMVNISQQHAITIARPPLMPYAPALGQAGVDLNRLLWVQPTSDKDCWWVMETALRSAACGLVVGWPGRIAEQQVRRLQLAAAEGRTLGVLMRPDGGRAPNVHLRLRLRRDGPQQLRVEIHKARGTHRKPSVVLPC